MFKMESVAHVIVEVYEVSPTAPHLPGDNATRAGSGCCVLVGEKRFLLTAYHLVHESTFVLASFRDRPLGRFSVANETPELDLALLEPDDPDALAPLTPIKIECRADPGDPIRTYGYSIVDTMEVIKGHVSGF